MKAAYVRRSQEGLIRDARWLPGGEVPQDLGSLQSLLAPVAGTARCVCAATGIGNASPRGCGFNASARSLCPRRRGDNDAMEGWGQPDGMVPGPLSCQWLGFVLLARRMTINYPWVQFERLKPKSASHSGLGGILAGSRGGLI